MAGKGEIKAGAAYVELWLKDNRFIGGLRFAEKRLKALGGFVSGLGTKLMGLGLAGAAGLAGSLAIFAKTGDALDKMAARTGVSVQALAELGYAAVRGGADINAVEKSIRMMQKKLGDAAGGSKEAAEAFAALGLSAEDLASLSPEEQFTRVAAAVAKIEDPTAKAAAAMKIFGARSGVALLPMLKDLDKARERARALGLVMSKEDTDAAARFTDMLADLWDTIKAVGVAIGAALAGGLSNLIEKMAFAIGTVSKWIKQNRGAVEAAALVVAGLVAAGIALTVLGGAFTALGMICGILATGITAIAMVIGALTTPVGLVAAAVIGLAGYLIYASGSGAKALGWLGEVFQELKETALAVWQGISDALAAGDLKLAAQILWAALKVEWKKGVNALSEVWLGFKQRFLELWTDAVYGLASMFVKGVAMLQEAWANFAGFVVDKWKAAEETLAQGIGFIIAKIEGIDPADVAKNLAEDYARQGRQREGEREQRLGEIERDRAGALEALEQDRQRKNREREAAYGEQLRTAAAELEALKKERDALLAEAAAKKAEAAGKPPPGDGKRPAMPDLAPTVSMGTFSAAAATLMGGGPAINRIAKATEETAKNTKRIAENGDEEWTD